MTHDLPLDVLRISIFNPIDSVYLSSLLKDSHTISIIDDTKYDNLLIAIKAFKVPLNFASVKPKINLVLYVQ